MADSVASRPSRCSRRRGDDHVTTTEPPQSVTVAGVFDEVCSNIARVIMGKDHVIRLTVTCLVAHGHLLFEDVPGRRQDVARQGAGPLDPTPRSAASSSPRTCCRRTSSAPRCGTSTTPPSSSDPGPIFANLLLGDEINRASPKTQSALLEAMAEEQVTVDGTTYALPRPFMVIATQNPLEHQGTFPLPESQLDRFLMRVSIGYPSRDDELALLGDRGPRRPAGPTPAGGHRRRHHGHGRTRLSRSTSRRRSRRTWSTWPTAAATRPHPRSACRREPRSASCGRPGVGRSGRSGLRHARRRQASGRPGARPPDRAVTRSAAPRDDRGRGRRGTAPGHARPQLMPCG